MSNSQWGEEIQKQAFEMWNENFSDSTEGIQPFTSPIPDSASLIVMGYNPGETPPGQSPSMTDQFLQGDFSLPETWDYAPNSETGADYAVANQLREHLFRNHLSYLDGDSVETNRYYLRTGGTGSHSRFDTVSEDTWDQYKEFCRETLNELITRVSPDLLVVFSTSAYNSLTSHADDVTVKEMHRGEFRGDEIKSLVHAEIDGVPVVATAHPSSCWTGEIKEQVRNRGPELLSEYLD